jgi:CRP-like cAMP-binding protein
MAIIDDSCNVRSASATALCKTELLRIAEENFETVLKSNPGFSLKMIKILVSRLRNVTNRLKKLESGRN